MAAPRRFSFRLLLLLALVPAGWWLLAASGSLGRLQNMATDWLFLWRGEIAAFDGTKPDQPPLKIVYVNVDSETIKHFGERPWPRGVYAELIKAIMDYGHAEDVGVDFILSPEGMRSSLLNRDLVHDSNKLMGDALEAYPTVVLACEYDDMINRYTNRKAQFPYLYQGFTKPADNGYPEGPTYPLVSTTWGDIGLINIAPEFSLEGAPDAVPRWVPLFAETNGPEYSLNLIHGMMDYLGLPDSALSTEDDQLILDAGNQLFVQPKIQPKTLYNLAVELALRHLGLDDSHLQRTPDHLQIIGNDKKIIMNIPLTDGQLVEVNWFSRWDNPALNPQVGASSVGGAINDLTSTDPKKKAQAEVFFRQFNGALVLIGPTDPILQDIAPTPFDPHPVPKVSVYGNLLKTFFSGEYLRRAPAWVLPLAIFLLTWLVAGLAIYSGPAAALAKLGALLVLAGYIFGVLTLFAHFTLVCPLIAPVASAATTAFGGVLVRLLDEEKQRQRIKGMFGTYLSPELVNKMVESGEEPKLGGVELPISIFFSDVQGFSSFSEILTPEKLVELMNEYLTAMTDILQAENGTLDKYIGDAVVAMFGAPIQVPNYQLRACVTACRMQKRLAELREKWIQEGDKWPGKVCQMRTRIGLNAGRAVVGNMGSASRFTYTMMGDEVNLGARLESGAKQFGVYSMCSEPIKTACEKIAKTVLFRRLDCIKVKGRSTPVEVYEVVSLREAATPDTLRCVELFEQGLAAYFAQQWDAAAALFAQAEPLEPLQPGRDPGVEHNPSELMQKRCREMKADPPPADWDGVLEMKEK